MSGQDSYLVVDSDEQLGARASLGDKEIIRVGSAYDNDIVLRSSEAGQLALCRESDGWSLEAIDGTVGIAGELLAVGQRSRIACDMPITVGTAGFHIEGLETFEPVAQRFALNNRVHKRSKLSYATLALLAGISAFAYLGLNDQWQLRAGDTKPVDTLSMLLKSDGLENVQIVGDEADSMVLMGRVESGNVLSKLRQLVVDSGHDAQLDIQVDSQLQQAVQDVFRTNGVDADVAVDGMGSVVVRTQTKDTQQLQDIETALVSDVPSLQALSIENKLPEDNSTGAAVVIDPKKEVETVVAGPTAYVITRDKSRYFVGAVLPSGHTITDIRDSTVYMVKAGVETQLVF